MIDVENEKSRMVEFAMAGRLKKGESPGETMITTTIYAFIKGSIETGEKEQGRGT